MSDCTGITCPECTLDGHPARNPRTARITFLEKKREVVKADLLVKLEDQDWHGCQDCGSDLRDIDSELKGLRL